MRWATCTALLLTCLAAFGCGSGNGGSGCTPTGFLMTAGLASDAQTSPDHSMKAPGNQTQFQAGEGAIFGPGCATPQVLHLAHAVWNVSDPVNVQISSADDASNGLATCLGTTESAVTVTATLISAGFTQTRQSFLTCR